MITVTATTYHHVSTNPDVKVSEYTLQGAICRLLGTEIGQIDRITSTASEVCFKLKVNYYKTGWHSTSWVELTYHGPSDELKLIEQIARSGLNCRHAEIPTILFRTIAPNGRYLQDLPWREAKALMDVVSTNPWRIYALFDVLRLELDYDVFHRWCNYAKLEEVVTLAVMAYQEKMTFIEVEQMMATT